MSSSSYFEVLLSKNGDSVQVFSLQETFSCKEQYEAISCKTHEKVLAFLEKIKSEEKGIFSFYHSNNPAYRDHKGPKGSTHRCSLDNQISFVKDKIFEAKKKNYRAFN